MDPQKKTDILKVAREQFFQQGYTQTPMSEIARRAGVAHGTLYLYFPSKESLALALSEDLFSRLTEAVVPSAEQATSLDEVMKVVESALDFIEREQDLVRMINLYAQLAASPARMEARRDFYARLALVFAEKMDLGILRRYEPQVAAELVVGLVEWVAEASILRGSDSLGGYRHTLLGFIRAALSPAA